LNIINTNTSKNYPAKTSDNFFHLFLNVSEGDMLEFNVSDGDRFNITNHRVSREDIKRGGLFSFNLTLESPPSSPPDFTVSSLSVDLENPIRGDVLNVSAVIGNIGGSVANSTVTFYDEKNISFFRFYWKMLNFSYRGEDIITQPGALKIRVHFADLSIQGNESYVKIYNRSDVPVNNLSSSLYLNDSWSNWSIGDMIKIEAEASELNDHVYFFIDKYEAVFAERSIELESGQTKERTARWNASAWLNDEDDLASGIHTIRVAVAPVANESNTENNNRSIVVEVKPINVDLTVSNISLDKTLLFDGDFVNVTATITNNGLEDATTNFTVIFKDGLGEGNASGIVFNKTSISYLSAGNSTAVTATWNATLGYHTLTVLVDAENTVTETDESNNIASTTVCVNKSRDFAVTDINISEYPGNLFSGEFVTINTTIEITNLANRGSRFDLCLYLDSIDNMLNRTSVKFAPGNETRYVVFNWTVCSAGDHRLFVIADPDYNIDELNETNNEKSVLINVSKKLDFEVMSLNITPSKPLIGDTLKINTIVKNNGTAPGSTTIEFYDNNNIKIEGFEVKKSLTIPNAKGIRVHFKYLKICKGFGCGGFIKVYDNNGTLIFNRTSEGIEEDECEKETDIWTSFGCGDTITIESQWAGFLINRYEAVLGRNETYLSAGESESFETHWFLTDKTSGLHNITVRVDPFDLVDELNETNNEQSQTITVNPSQDFSLKIDFNNTVLLYDIVPINVTVKNSGVRGGEVEVAFYLDYDETPSWQRKPFNSTSLYVGANDTNNTIVIWNASVAGNHTITAIVDPSDKVRESNETNNNFTKEIFVNGTDLVVSRIEVPETCYLGDIVKINATIKNIGAVNASDIKVIFKDGIGDTNTSGVEFANETIPFLAAGNSTAVHAEWNLTKAKTGFHTITVNIPFSSTDNNPDNNMDYVVRKVVACWDFAVLNVHTSPTKVKEGANVTVYANISNEGRDEKVDVGFYISIEGAVPSGIDPLAYYELVGAERGWKRDNITNATGVFLRIGYIEGVELVAGEIKEVNITWNAYLTGGNHTIMAVVDPYEKIDEYNSSPDVIADTDVENGIIEGTNNVKNCTLFIIPPELSLNLSIHPDEPVIGDVINVTATVTNKGNEYTNSTVLFFATNKTENFTIGYKEVHLEPGEQYNYSIKWNTSSLKPANYSILCKYRQEKFH